MYEINQHVLFDKAKRDHQTLLASSDENRLIASARPRTPQLWDAVTLNVGNWLIDLGCNLRSRSLYTKLAKKHA